MQAKVARFTPEVCQQAAPRLYRIVRMVQLQAIIDACNADDLDFLDMLAEYLDDEPFSQQISSDDRS